MSSASAVGLKDLNVTPILVSSAAKNEGHRDQNELLKQH